MNIFFRGKRVDNGEWVYGDLNNQLYGSFKRKQIVQHEKNGSFGYMVDPATVGQYTGREDKKGKRIFKGDILGCDNICKCSIHYLIEWNEKHCCFTSIELGLKEDIDEDIQYHLMSNMRLDVCEIIGNIHDKERGCKE